MKYVSEIIITNQNSEMCLSAMLSFACFDDSMSNLSKLLLEKPFRACVSMTAKQAELLFYSILVFFTLLFLH